jgi:DNA-directed RNA polymerase subunit RPC12/RpoP
MALMACHECGKQVSSEAKACPSCGAKPTINPSDRDTRIKWALVILTVFAVGISLDKSTEKTQPIGDPIVYSKSPVPLDQGAYIEDFYTKDNYALLDALVKEIRNRGNVCDTVKTARLSQWDGATTILCNNLKYEYEFKDVGGVLQFKVIR